ncbi:hypothetical protein GF354_00480 [Candidatus Peregrinibacteria bacterium]|nr:hypothetical protein [Candidatus Peregrinibacteria bacterium]
MAAISLILKNQSSTDIELDLTDQYGGNFNAQIPASTSQNHTLMEGSKIKSHEQALHTVNAEDTNKEIVIAE